MPREVIDLSAGTAEEKIKKYTKECKEFSWDQVRAELGCREDGWMNIAQVALERHAAGCQCKQLALRSISSDGTRRDFTYCDFTLLADKFATVLRKLGIDHGDRMFIMGPSSVEMYIAIFGALQNGTVVAPLKNNLTSGPIATRLGLGKGKVLVTTPELFQSKIAALWRMMPSLEHVILINYPGETDHNLHDFDELMAVAPSDCVLPNTKPTDPAFLHYITDNKGRLISVLESHSALLAHFVAGKHVLNLQPNTIFWNSTDIGSKTGLSCGVIASFLHGAVCVIDEADFEPARCYRILQEEKVNAWMTSGIVLSALKSAGSSLAKKYRLSALRHISCDEEMSEELIAVASEFLRQQVYRTGWSTVTGRILIASLPMLPHKQGALGLPLPGVEASIVKWTDAENMELVKTPLQEGELVIRCTSPDLCNDLLHKDIEVAVAMKGDYLLTGLTGYKDEDGYIYLKELPQSTRESVEKSLSNPFKRVLLPLIQSSVVIYSG